MRMSVARVVTVGLAVLAFTSVSARATVPGPVNGRLAFVREYDGGGVNGYEIVTMDPNGGNLRRLTQNQVVDFQPIWSPGGGEIVFESFREGNVSELYRMNSDGTGAARLTTNGPPEDRPGTYHPDGSQLVFHT